jgi:hypothetical protein
MEEGFIPYMAAANVIQLTWHPGSPENKKFLGWQWITIPPGQSPQVNDQGGKYLK